MPPPHPPTQPGEPPPRHPPASYGGAASALVALGAACAGTLCLVFGFPNAVVYEFGVPTDTPTFALWCAAAVAFDLALAAGTTALAHAAMRSRRWPIEIGGIVFLVGLPVWGVGVVVLYQFFAGAGVV